MSTFYNFRFDIVRQIFIVIGQSQNIAVVDRTL